MKKRFIELLKKADDNTANKGITDYNEAIADNATYLLSEGVIVPPCKVGDTVSVRATCECVITTPCYEECRNMCPFEIDCECEDCDNANERIFDTTVSSIFNNGQGWYIEFKHLCPFARFTDIGISFFVGENAHEQAVAYNKALAERSENK